jgi:large subunit ribosomal protein L33
MTPRAPSDDPTPPKEPEAAEISGGSGPRTRVSLACTECESRNYKTTRKPDLLGQLSLKKFCPRCNKHTIHKETK